MKNYFFKISLYIKIIIFFISITTKKSSEIIDYSFLENTTIDRLRQIFGEILLVFKNEDPNYYETYKTYLKGEFEKIWEKNATRSSIKNKIKEEIEKVQNKYNIMEKIQEIAQNYDLYFKIDSLASLKALIDREDLDKKYLINFAFNIDKYDRTQKKNINSASDYINYYTKDELKKFIHLKLDYYFNINTCPKILKKIVLNDYDFNFKDLKSYISSRTELEYIQLIYGYEYYCFNSELELVSKDGCSVAYSIYDRNKLDTYSRQDFDIKLTIINKKLNFNDDDLDNYIYLIENREFSYPNNYELFEGLSKDTLVNNILTLEAYYKRREKKDKSLTCLREYVNNISKYENEMKDILDWGIDTYPELGIKGIFEDIASSETDLKYGEVKLYVKDQRREILLKYAYNIHSYQNKITSIYHKNIYDFIRMNNNKLIEQISQDTNHNKILQEKKNFELYANLHRDDLKAYLYNLQRSQLKMVTIELIKFYYTNYLKEERNENKKTAEKKEIIDSLIYLNKAQLIEKALNYAKDCEIDNPKQLFILDDKILKYFSYYDNIMDFFQSTNINYLRLWLRKYETKIRKNKNKNNLSGGLKNNFKNLNEYTKEEILNIFDIYVNEYPKLFDPKRFIKYVGLNKGITPHKYLVENAKDKDLINKILLSMVGHVQRKNIQLNFDDKGILAYILFDNQYNITTEIENRYLYALFRIINIYPELNNQNLFELMCVNNSTRIINLIEEDSKTDLVLYNLDDRVKNIAYFNNHNITEINSDIKKINYVKHFIDDFTLDDILKSRVLDGDFWPIRYDNKYYLKKEKNITINNIYIRLKNNNKIDGIYNSSNDYDYIDYQIKSISEAIDKFEELQNATDFELKYNYIDIDSEGYSDLESLFNFLNKTDNKYIYYYCLIANILKIKYIKYANEVNGPKDIYTKIRFMSRNSMIRYILDIAKINNEDIQQELTENNLPLLVKKYMLDIGSDNIIDLTIC